MFFKNLMLYRLTEKWELSAEDLAAKLEEHEFHPCGSLDLSRYGFVPPLGDHGTDFVHATNGYIMICAKNQTKLLPSAVINEQMNEKARAISLAEQRSVGRKERQTLKDEIIFSLLPKAFTRSTLEYAYISPKENLIYVNSSSAKRAEDLLSKLREALGSLRCIPLSMKMIPTQVMTHFVQTGKLGESHKFELGESAEFHAGKDDRVIRCKRQDLSADEIISHINSGMYVSKLALTWNESIHFVVDEKAVVRGLKFDDIIMDKANDRNPESKAEQFDADFAVMSLELSAFTAALIDCFGGEQDVDESTNGAPRDSDDDIFYKDAVAFVKEQGVVSISAVQRKFRLGYNRTARLIERMEVEKIVSHADSGGVRTVLI